MSESAQPEAKRQRIEQQDDHPNPPTDATTEDAKKMAQETSKMEAEATAEGELPLALDRIHGCRHVSFLADARADDMVEARKAEAEVRTWLARLCGFGCRCTKLDSLFRGRPVCSLAAS